MYRTTEVSYGSVRHSDAWKQEVGPLSSPFYQPSSCRAWWCFLLDPGGLVLWYSGKMLTRAFQIIEDTY